MRPKHHGSPVSFEGMYRRLAKKKPQFVPTHYVTVGTESAVDTTDLPEPSGIGQGRSPCGASNYERHLMHSMYNEAINEDDGVPTWNEERKRQIRRRAQ